MPDAGYVSYADTSLTTDAGPAVLVCEDREDVNGTVTEFFESYDLPSVSAFDTKEAERLLDAYRSSIRLALVDMSMHRDARGGYDFVLTQALRYPSARFVLMTAHDLSNLDRQKLLDCNIGFYQKPFDLEEIVGLMGNNDGTPSESQKVFNGENAVEYQNPTKDEIFSTVVTLQTRERHLVRRWRKHAEGLVRQIISTSPPSGGPIFINGRRYVVNELVHEINACTPLGERLVELHYRLIDKLLQNAGK